MDVSSLGRAYMAKPSKRVSQPPSLSGCVTLHQCAALNFLVAPSVFQMTKEQPGVQLHLRMRLHDVLAFET